MTQRTKSRIELIAEARSAAKEQLIAAQRQLRAAGTNLLLADAPVTSDRVREATTAVEDAITRLEADDA